MTRTLCSMVLAIGPATPPFADVTLKQTTTGKERGLGGQTTRTTFIKGNRMRNDVVLGDKTQTSIYDLDAQKMYIFDSKKQEADVWDMAAFAAEVGKSVDVSSTKASLKPNNQTKQIGGKTASGYDLEVSMNAAMAGGKDMNMTVTLAGPVWIVKGAPGAADYARFYKAAVEKGWIFSDPRGAKAQPGQAKALAEMYRQMANIGGIPYATDVQIKMSGSGPMAGLLAKIGNVTMTTTTDSVDVAPLAADLFAPPAGYKLNQRSKKDSCVLARKVGAIRRTALRLDREGGLMALTDRVNDWWIYADTVVAAAIGLAVARYDFYLYSPKATQGHAAHVRLSIWGGGFGGHASSVPLPETPKDWLELDCLRKFSVWD